MDFEDSSVVDDSAQTVSGAENMLLNLFVLISLFWIDRACSILILYQFSLLCAALFN